MGLGPDDPAERPRSTIQSDSAARPTWRRYAATMQAARTTPGICAAAILLACFALWWLVSTTRPELNKAANGNRPHLAQPPNTPAIEREASTGRLAPSVLVVAKQTQRPLPQARVTSDSVIAFTNEAGVAVDESWTIEQTAQVHLDGYFAKSITLAEQQTSVALDKTMLVTGAIRFDHRATPPPAASLRMTRVGRDTVDERFIAELIRVAPDYSFQFLAKEATKQTIELTLGLATTLAKVHWVYPQRHLDMHASLPPQEQTAIARQILVTYPPEFLASWLEHAANVSSDWAVVNLVCVPAGTLMPRGTTAGAAVNVRGKALAESPARYEVSLPSGRWDLLWQDRAHGVTYAFRDIRMSDTDLVHTLTLPPVGNAVFRFEGVLANEVSLAKHPAYVQTLDQQGEVAASAYADDGMLTARAANVPAGNYLAIGMGRSPKHRLMRTAPIPFTIAAGQDASLTIPLRPAHPLTISTVEALTNGVIENNAGVVVHRIQLPNGGTTATALPTGDYLIRYAWDGSRYDRSVTIRDAKGASVSLP